MFHEFDSWHLCKLKVFDATMKKILSEEKHVGQIIQRHFRNKKANSDTYIVQLCQLGLILFEVI